LAQSFATPDEWKRWIGSIPSRLYRNLEIQANTMAAQILMPLPNLTQCFEETIAIAAAQGVDWKAGPNTIYRQLAKKFGVAPESVRYALRNEGLAEDPRNVD
jgi:Zn-dependent peptidase ImmA (M78 family)